MARNKKLRTTPAATGEALRLLLPHPPPLLVQLISCAPIPTSTQQQLTPETDIIVNINPPLRFLNHSLPDRVRVDVARPRLHLPHHARPPATRHHRVIRQHRLLLPLSVTGHRRHQRRRWGSLLILLTFLTANTTTICIIRFFRGLLLGLALLALLLRPRVHEAPHNHLYQQQKGTHRDRVSYRLAR